ncbi:MAG TPA: hypothetical protein V6C52_15330 [Coleofasciculaceae cyanobacterium]|jgi:adenylate cyclase class IV
MSLISNFAVQTEPRFGKKRAEPATDADRVAKLIRKAQQGIPGEAMNPAEMARILLNMGFQPEHPDKPQNKRFLLEGVRVNIDRVHGDLKGVRHLDVEGLQDHSKAKVHYFA